MRDQTKAPFNLAVAARLKTEGKSYREIAKRLHVGSYHTIKKWLDSYVPPPPPALKPKPSPASSVTDIQRQIQKAVMQASAQFTEPELKSVEHSVMAKLAEPTPQNLGVIGLDAHPVGERTVWVTSDEWIFNTLRNSSGHAMIQLKRWHPSLAKHPVFALVQVIWNITPERQHQALPGSDEAWEASRRLQRSLEADREITVRECDYKNVPIEAFQDPPSEPIIAPPMIAQIPMAEQLRRCWQIGPAWDNNDAEALRAPGSAIVAGTE